MDQNQSSITSTPSNLNSSHCLQNHCPLLLSGLKVAIVYSDAKREYFATEEHYLTEAEVFDRVKLITPYLEKMGQR